MEMKKAVIINPVMPGLDKSSIGWREAFAEGLRRRGWIVVIDTNYYDCDLLVLWGVRRQDLINKQRLLGREICILERGYLGDRYKYTSVSFGGGLNGRGIFRGPFTDNLRFRGLFGHLLRPWEFNFDGYVLVMGQVPGDQSIRGVDIHGWYARVVQALRREGYKDIRFRPHPRAGRGGTAGLRAVTGDLDAALAGAAIVVTYNSNAAVDAVLYGRPTIAMDEGSMAWDMAGHQIDDIRTPNRAAWCSRLAWCQYSIDEFRSGTCADRVGL